MWKISLLLMCLLSCQLNGVVPNEFDHCFYRVTDRWERADLDAELEQEFLSLMYEGKKIGSQFYIESQYPVEEVWFKSKNGEFQLCRYEVTNDPCSSRAEAALFWKEGQIYKTIKLVDKICVENGRR